MNWKNLFLFVILVFLLALIPPGTASADMGPKPSMSFEFVQEDGGTELTIVSASLYFCEQADCSDAQETPPVGNMGAYGFSCAERSCFSMYGGTYYQLQVTFSDGVTRKSNIFTKTYSQASYEVTIKPATLHVRELQGTNSTQTLFWLRELFPYLCPAAIVIIVIVLAAITLRSKAEGEGEEGWLVRLGKILFWLVIVTLAFSGLILSWKTFLVTLIIETVVAIAWFYFNATLPSLNRGLYALLIANTFTQPVFVFVLKQIHPLFGAPFGYVVLVAEILIVLVETLFYYFMLPEKPPFRKALLMSFILNAASFGIGLLLPF